MNEPMIGRLHRVPLLPVRRSTNTGYCGPMSNWHGTARQLSELEGWVRRDPEARWGFRYVFAFATGFVLALAVLTR